MDSGHPIVRGVSKSMLASSPLRKLREQSNLTQEQIAERCNISAKTVYLAECGVYEAPLEAVAHYFCKTRDIELAELTQEYASFRAKVRNKLKSKINPADFRFDVPHTQVTTFKTPFGTRLAPIKDFYTNCLVYTQSEFCKGFLVNPGLLHRLEVGYEYRHVPSSIVEALVECGAPNHFMKELDVRTVRFHSTA